MSMDKSAQREFILEYIRQHGAVDACNEDFNDVFKARFGGNAPEYLYGSQPVYKAMRLLSEMYRERLLTRFRIGLSEMPSGFPKWVYSYDINPESDAVK